MSAKILMALLLFVFFLPALHAINIASCSAGTLVLAGAYDVTANLDSVTATTCISANHADITVAGHNYNIVGHAGAGNSGVYTALNDVNFTDSNISNFTHGVWYDSGASNGYASNMTVNCSGNTFGVYMLTTTNISFKNGNVWCNGADAIRFQGSGTPSWNNSAINNTLTGSYGGSAQSPISVYWTSMNTTIANNTITCGSTYTSEGCIQILRFSNYTRIINNTISSNGLMDIDSGDDLGTLIANNTFNQSGDGTLMVRLTNTGYANNINATVSGNTFNSTGNPTYMVKTIGGASGANIANNTFWENKGGSLCFYMQNNGASFTIYNNTCNLTAAGAGAYGILLAGATDHDFNISRNTWNISGSGSPGVELDGASNNSITNNTFQVCSTCDALIMDSATTNNTAYYNSFVGTAGSYISNAAAGNTNTFNTTVGGVAKGNIYANVTSGAYAVLLTSSANNGWADSGTKYPANGTNTPGLFKSTSKGNDSGPGTITSPDLSCVFAPTVLAVIFQPTLPLPCPATANNVYPVNQSNPAGLYQCTNNGTGSGTLQMKVNQTDANIVKVGSCDYFTHNLTLNSTYQDLTGSCATLAAGATINVSRYNNYSTCVIPRSNMSIHIRS